MRRFRKIIVNEEEYRWLFRYDDYDYINDPYLLVVKSSQPKASLRIVFSVKDHFLLNSGLPALFQGTSVLINLNQPSYVSEMIRQCGKDGMVFGQKGDQHVDGAELLKKLGYDIII